jgi:hypothetical protein
MESISELIVMSAGNPGTQLLLNAGGGNTNSANYCTGVVKMFLDLLGI